MFKRISINEIFHYLSRDSIAFATESCFASLANCIGCHDNMNQPIPKEIEDFKLHDIEIRYGIVQVQELID